MQNVDLAEISFIVLLIEKYYNNLSLCYVNNHKMKRIKKILKYLLILIIIAAIFAVAPALFYKKKTNDNPLPSFYKKGVYHLHSTFSDGTGNLKDITGAASSLNLDFIILTDHGRPNIECAKSTAFYNGVLLMGGSEFSLNCGHLAAVGFQIPGYIFPPEPREAIADVIAGGGICFISHPFHRIAWTDWDVENFTGIEVLSASSCAGKISILQALAFLVRYPINKNFALLKTLHYPVQNIKMWNHFNTTGEYYGIYALDAHAKLEISEKISFHFPSYQSMFRIFNVYVKVAKDFSPDAGDSSATIISALKKGNFFNVIEAIAPANGFEAVFTGNDGSVVEMGGSSAAEQGFLKINLPFSFATDIAVKRNGKLFKKIPGNREQAVEIAVDRPGVYFIEVYVSNSSFNKLPWIMTNPFFLNRKYLSGKNFKEKAVPEMKKLLVEDEGFFQAEPGAKSQGVVSYGKTADGELLTKFNFHLQEEPGKKDFWSCLVRRGEFDFSGWNGLVFEAKSDKRKRFWVELRTKGKTGEKWYSHSFSAGSEWQRIGIPFHRFHFVFGKREKPELSKISSIFFTINSGIAYPGTEGSLELKNIGFY
jgi:hypothetical protein